MFGWYSFYFVPLGQQKNYRCKTVNFFPCGTKKIYFYLKLQPRPFTLTILGLNLKKRGYQNRFPQNTLVPTICDYTWFYGRNQPFCIIGENLKRIKIGKNFFFCLCDLLFRKMFFYSKSANCRILKLYTHIYDVVIHSFLTVFILIQ